VHSATPLEKSSDSSTLEEILKGDNNIMKVERCNITKVNNDKNKYLIPYYLD
jgi:hypothetical protein